MQQDCWLYMDGVFDLVHAGHFNAMRQASQLSRWLCVGVNDDADVFQCKGYRPVIRSAERAAIISACKWVDRVIDSTPYVTSVAFLRDRANCDFVAHGDDEVATTAGADCYAEPRAAGLFKVFRRTDGISSTEVTARLQLASQDLGFLPRVLDSKTQPTQPVTTPISSARLVAFATRGAKGNALRCAVDLRRAQSPVDAWCAAAPTPAATTPVIYTQGSFDVLRGEHVAFLEYCKSKGGFLIVGILSDAACAALDPENEHCPILGVNDRMLNLLALRVVDEVICNVEWTLDEGLLSAHQVEQVILPADSARLSRLPAPSDRCGTLPVTRCAFGASVNDLRTTLADFARVALAADDNGDRLHARCQKNYSLVRSRATKTATCAEI